MRSDVQDDNLDGPEVGSYVYKGLFDWQVNFRIMEEGHGIARKVWERETKTLELHVCMFKKKKIKK